MNRKMVGERLVKMAEDMTGSDVADHGKTVASEMIKLAKELVSFDVPAELQKSADALGDLASQFKKTQADLVKEIADMEKQLKDKQNLLKSFFKGWEVQSGYRKARAELLDQATQCMSIGDTLSDLAGEIEIAHRESTQESYKEKYNILVSTLNEAELKKYSRILNSFFNKQTTEVKTGLKELDGAVKEWHDTAQAIAEERGVKLPKAGLKEAGFVRDVVDALKTIVPKLVDMVKSWGASLYNRFRNNGKVLDVMESKLNRMVAVARRVL